MRISDWSSDVCSSDLFGDAADDLAVDEGDGGRVLQVDAQAAVLLADLDVEVGVQLLRGARIVRRAAGGQHRQGAAAQQVVHAAAGGIAQARDFVAGENVEAAARVDAGDDRSEEHTSELQTLLRKTYAGFCLYKKTTSARITSTPYTD